MRVELGIPSGDEGWDGIVKQGFTMPTPLPGSIEADCKHCGRRIWIAPDEINGEKVVSGCAHPDCRGLQTLDYKIPKTQNKLGEAQAKPTARIIQFPERLKAKEPTKA